MLKGVKLLEGLSDKFKREIVKLEGIARKKNYQLSYITILNLLNEHNLDLTALDKIYKYFNKIGIEIVSEDIELEELEDLEEISTNLKPFDQTKIDISMRTLTLDLIIKRLENDEINLMPNFQRKGDLWNQQTKSRLIESLILRIPLPAFYFDGTNDEEWLIIDGLQRLTAVKEFFVTKKLELEGLEFLKDFNHCTYQDLPRTYTRRMEETQIIAFIVNPGTPSPVKYNIFKRINTAGLELEPQEIRHALYQGKSTKLLEKLAQNENFLKATDYSIKIERMQDREFILRFLAFRENGIKNYEGVIDDYLNDTMEIINGYGDEQIAQLEKEFDEAMQLAYAIFENNAFRKIFSKESRRNPINRALFEIWSVAFSQLSESDKKKLVRYKEELLDKFIQLMNDKASNFSIDVNSGKKTAVIRRFENVERLIMEVLQ